ncbi:MAG TPA: hypothetical protein VGM56_30460, partial [Byssovorax sp.]
RRRGKDSPLVNQKEGAVLVEIIEADHVFDALAKQTQNIVQRLPLGKTLSRMARSKPKGAAKPPAPPAPPAPAPPAPPAEGEDGS